MTFQLVTVVLAALLALPATAAAGPGSPTEPRGIPFSMDDLGWIALVAMLLLVLALSLQGIARSRRRSAPVQVVQRRTEA
jgi:formate hydrogenlyase subunit 3/multisubunit Na+/H+ antiporter MnhD subunit